VTVI
jgi:hypothetical protein